MRDLIRLEDAIRILSLMLAGRNSRKQRLEIEAALSTLRLAQTAPEVRAALHHPVIDVLPEA